MAKYWDEAINYYNSYTVSKNDFNDIPTALQKWDCMLSNIIKAMQQEFIDAKVKPFTKHQCYLLFEEFSSKINDPYITIQVLKEVCKIFIQVDKDSMLDIECTEDAAKETICERNSVWNEIFYKIDAVPSNQRAEQLKFLTSQAISDFMTIPNLDDEELSLRHSEMIYNAVDSVIENEAVKIEVIKKLCRAFSDITIEVNEGEIYD